jgi:hypothetical protein
MHTQTVNRIYCEDVICVTYFNGTHWITNQGVLRCLIIDDRRICDWQQGNPEEWLNLHYYNGTFTVYMKDGRILKKK